MKILCFIKNGIYKRLLSVMDIRSILRYMKMSALCRNDDVSEATVDHHYWDFVHFNAQSLPLR